jgi:outer membrane protease
MRNFTKKLFTPLALISTLMLGSTAYAQDYYSNSRHSNGEKNFRLGLSINPNIGWLRYDNDYEASSKAGFSYGLLADLGFARNYYFSTGLLINAINSKVDAAGISKDVYLKYAEVPLTVKYLPSRTTAGRWRGMETDRQPFTTNRFIL